MIAFVIKLASELEKFCALCHVKWEEALRLFAFTFLGEVRDWVCLLESLHREIERGSAVLVRAIR